MLTVDSGPQASKNSPKRLRASKKKTSTGPTGPVNIRVNKFPLKNVPQCFGINVGNINENKCCR